MWRTDVFVFVLGHLCSAETQSDSGSVVHPGRSDLSSRRCSKKPEQSSQNLHPQLPFSPQQLDQEVCLHSNSGWVQSTIMLSFSVVNQVNISKKEHAASWVTSVCVCVCVVLRVVLGVCVQTGHLQAAVGAPGSPLCSSCLVWMHLLQHTPRPLTVCRLCSESWTASQLHLYRGNHTF